jgi:hypothetical protein
MSGDLFLALGLPGGSFSAFLTGACRYFSLPLNPALLAGLRKKAEGLKTPGAALAAAAATDKGVSLEDKTLAGYAAALDPGSERDAGAGKDREGGGQMRGKSRPETGSSPHGGPAGGVFKGSGSFEEADAGALRDLAAGIDPRWELLNRLPGRDGGRWMVFPLNYALGDDVFPLTLRLLLDEGPALPLGIRRLSADIVGPGRRWLFVLDRPGPGGELRLYLNPGPSGAERRRLEEKIRRAFLPLAARVRVLEAGIESFVLDGESGMPPPLDEEA